MTYKVVINAQYGGFSLSAEASAYLNEHYDAGIDEAFGYIYNDKIPRHHEGLVHIVETLGSERASGFCAKLKVVEIDSPMYRIDEYDGYESVEVPDSIDWVVIDERK